MKLNNTHPQGLLIPFVNSVQAVSLKDQAFDDGFVFETTYHEVKTLEVPFGWFYDAEDKVPTLVRFWNSDDVEFNNYYFPEKLEELLK